MGYGLCFGVEVGRLQGIVVTNNVVFILACFTQSLQ